MNSHIACALKLGLIPSKVEEQGLVHICPLYMKLTKCTVLPKELDTLIPTTWNLVTFPGKKNSVTNLKIFDWRDFWWGRWMGPI